MVDLKELKPGDRVKIVDEWTDMCMASSLGEMDHWLGKVMTVRSVNSVYAMMIEDEGECEGQYEGHWYWFEPAIDCIVSRSVGSEAHDNDEPEFSGDEFLSVLTR